MTLAIVPVKPFGGAKSRLSAAFSPSERGELAQAMLGDVFEALARAEGLAGVLVVTRDAQAAAMARAMGFEPIDDEATEGINAAAAIGLRLAAARNAAALIAPGDIPFLSADEIGAILRASETAPIAVAPAARDGGTNLLAMARADLMAPAFGPDSAARHIARAKALGLATAVLRLRGASHDIDVPADLETLPEDGAPRTRAFLARALVACEGMSP